MMVNGEGEWSMSNDKIKYILDILIGCLKMNEAFNPVTTIQRYHLHL